MSIKKTKGNRARNSQTKKRQWIIMKKTLVALAVMAFAG
ncbi:porin, partial [Vibrio vulnificus]